jgi:tripartite-type tricarboxylate transporter receptor subunit TctC
VLDANNQKLKRKWAAARFLSLAALTPLVALHGMELLAQGFPAKPVRYIMPLPAGSETDVFARVFTRRLTESWDQQVIVENRPGGGTTIGTEIAAKSASDGYTLLHAITAHAINATLHARLPYDTLKDFACITHIGTIYGLLVAHPSFPPSNIKELIALAKSRPGQITYASGGSGTSNHIAAEALRLAAKIDIVHVPYKGSSLAFLDLIPGRIPFMTTVLVEAMPHIRSRKVKVLAMTSAKRAPSLPEVPTVTESLPSYRSGTVFWALIARNGTPQPIIAKLHADAIKAIGTADVRDRLNQSDIEVVGSTPEQCDAFLRDQIAVWGAIVKASGARVD